MCGHIVLFGQDIWIDCEVRREWWYDPGPLLDLRRLKLRPEEVSGPHPEPWKVELTKIIQILDSVGQIESDSALASRLGSTVAEAGNAIAQRAEVDIQFMWEEHKTEG